jgi:hypothetical protein
MNKSSTTKPIESDAFDLDAIEGFANVEGSSAYYDRLRKKQSNSIHTWKWITLSLGIGAFLFFGILSASTSNKTPKYAGKKNIDATKKDTQLMTVNNTKNSNKLPEHQLIKSKTIAANFSKQKTVLSVNENIDFDMSSLPLIKVSTIEYEKTLEANRRVIRKIGSEIYAHDLKLLDYTKYRNASAFRLSQKEVELSGIPANKYDSESEIFKDEFVEITYSELIDQATLAFSKENFKQALSLYNIILSVYPDDVNALFYSAICYRNYGNYNKSIESLENLIMNNYANFDEESLWYLAENHMRLKNLAVAKIYYERIVSDKGFYSVQAMAKLKKLK